MDLASDGINCEALLRCLPSSIVSFGQHLMDLTLLMMDLAGSECSKELLGLRTYPLLLFFISTDSLQLFLCVKKAHYLIMRQLNINILKFEYFVETAPWRGTSVQPSFKCSRCETISCDYAIQLWQKRGKGSALHLLYLFSLILTGWFLTHNKQINLSLHLQM